MKTKIFTGHTLDLRDVVGISGIINESNPPVGKYDGWRHETVFYIYLKYVPNPIRHVFNWRNYKEEARLQPDCPFVPKRRDDVKYEPEAIEQFNNAEWAAIAYEQKFGHQKFEAEIEALIEEWKKVTESVDSN